MCFLQWARDGTAEETAPRDGGAGEEGLAAAARRSASAMGGNEACDPEERERARGRDEADAQA